MFNIKLSHYQSKPIEEILEASDKEPTATFTWSPVVDGKFLMEEPTPEYMATPGLLDRFNIMVGCTSGEVKKI